MIVPAKVPWLVKKMLTGRIWQMDGEVKNLYLTFDDGPHESITPKVLDLLHKYDAKATFFCIGDRVKKHPDIFSMIKEQDHAIGNHTYFHVNGWKMGVEKYVEDVMKANEVIDSKMFRPPYGRLTSKQFQQLRQLGFKTVMWTVLSGDYNKSLSPEECTKRVINNLKPGSIILFHDSEKAEANMLYCLEKTLSHAQVRGYGFKALTFN